MPNKKWVGFPISLHAMSGSEPASSFKSKFSPNSIVLALSIKVMRNKNFRKRSLDEDPESEDEQEHRLALEEVRFLQKQRERRIGIPAIPTVRSGSNGLHRSGDKGEGDGEKEDLVLQDTFAQETAVTVEDPNM